MEKMHSKVATRFDSKVPESANLTNQNKEISEIITSTHYKKNSAGPRKTN